MDRVPEATGDYSALAVSWDDDFLRGSLQMLCGIAMVLPLGESPDMMSPAK
jgi:hypothetical protein